MIRVTITDNMDIIKSVFSEAEENSRMAIACENEKNTGYFLFYKDGELKSYIDNDNIFELLVRSALNHLDLNGVKEGYSENSEMEGKLLLLGFKKDGEKVKVDIGEFFKPCSCCK
ncbi:MAG: hypothetical protein IKA17_10790 [Clostridia bacterium]|nr:hypothetical protein [Clostridia bacterium]